MEQPGPVHGSLPRAPPRRRSRIATRGPASKRQKRGFAIRERDELSGPESASDSESDSEEAIESNDGPGSGGGGAGNSAPPPANTLPPASTPSVQSSTTSAAPTSRPATTPPPKTTPPPAETPRPAASSASSHRGLVPVLLETQSTLSTTTRSTPSVRSEPPAATTPAKIIAEPQTQNPTSAPSSSSSSSSSGSSSSSSSRRSPLPTTTTTSTRSADAVLPGLPMITPLPEDVVAPESSILPLTFSTVTNIQESLSATETPVAEAPAVGNSTVNAGIGIGTVSGLAAIVGFIMILSRSYKQRSRLRGGSPGASMRNGSPLPTAKPGPLPGTFEPFKPIMLPPGMTFTVIPKSSPPVPRAASPSAPPPAMVPSMNMSGSAGYDDPSATTSPENPFISPQELDYRSGAGNMSDVQMPQRIAGSTMRASSMYPDGANMYPPLNPPLPDQVQEMGSTSNYASYQPYQQQNQRF